MKRSRRLLVVLGTVVGLLMATQAVAWADPPPTGVGDEGQFLCPAVGNETAAEANGKGWGALPNGNFTFLPGGNQAGAHVPDNALNADNPGASPGPGHNPDWSPIWPGTAFDDV